MGDLISIIIPVYNGERYLRQTLTRVLNSSYKELDIIVILDGSTDGSGEICQSMKDSRIRIFEKENGGIVSARNFGLGKATGEYVCFCDQDDFVDTDMYCKLLEGIKQARADICFCGSGMYLDGEYREHRIIQKQGICEKGEINECFLEPLLFWDKRGLGWIKNYPGTIWNCIFRHSFIRENDIWFYPCTNFEDDKLFVLDCLSYAVRVATISETLYYWRASFQSESYRKKYISNYLEKRQKVDGHVMQALERAELASDGKKRVEREAMWEAIRISYKNECSDLNQHTKKERRRSIRLCIKAYKDSLPELKKYDLIKGARFSVFYYMMKYGFAGLSLSFYRRYLMRLT